MRSAGEQPQHARRILIIRRLPQDLAFDDHGRVGRKHASAGHAPADRTALGLGHAADVDLWRFAGFDVLVDVGRLDVDLDPGFPQQVGASRRRGGQNQHGS